MKYDRNFNVKHGQSFFNTKPKFIPDMNKKDPQHYNREYDLVETNKSDQNHKSNQTNQIDKSIIVVYCVLCNKIIILII